ncbi:MAG: LPXTG cell wall anchor domain-containing protein, partial [Baileyella intestinalis]|uniref:LPXTG cell wall anchor domain-containing protein n=1 Tax=Baileyella intestinalis TaxID=2606709 RepID=UPI0023F05426
TPDKKTTPGDNTNSNSNTNSGSTTTTNTKITRTGDAQGTPRTGDDTAFELYASMLGISGAALAAFVVARRRRNSLEK